MTHVSTHTAAIPPASFGDLDGNNGFTLNGVGATDFAGWNVANGGDVNGDGFDDAVVGMPGANANGRSDAGEIYIVLGRSGPFAAETDLDDLDGSNSFRIDGANAGDSIGVSVNGGGDADGDGQADIIIGAPGADPGGRIDAGQSYVVLGGGQGSAADLDLAALDGTNGVGFDGVDAYDRTGASVSIAGDVNGDGLDDVVVGAWGGDPSGNINAGESYVVFGTALGFPANLDLTTLDGNNGFRIDGLNAYDGMGSSVSDAGDINGDGLDDLVIGAPGADPNGNINAGTSYVVFGTAAGFPASLDLAALDGSNGFRIDGVNAGDQAGKHLSTIGDVNGDGIADVVVAATGAGSSYVVFGNPPGFAASLNLAALDGTNGFRIDGATLNIDGTNPVSGAGDVNGDGLDDIVLGDPAVDQAGATGDITTNATQILAGATYVVFGSNQGFPASLSVTALDGTNGFRTIGDDSNGGAGWSVGGGGDVNGDGFDDIVAGAPVVGGPIGLGVGAGYVTFGGDFTASVTGAGTAGNDLLSGGAGPDVMVAGLGDDTLTGNGGADVLRGGSGNDILVVADAAFLRLDGGGGSDTLRAAGFDLDLTTIQDLRIADVEAIDLTDGAANQVTLGLSDLRNLSDTSNTITITGDAGDRVAADLQGAGFMRTDLGTGFVEHSNGILSLLVQDSLDDSAVLF